MADEPDLDEARELIGKLVLAHRAAFFREAINAARDTLFAQLLSLHETMPGLRVTDYPVHEAHERTLNITVGKFDGYVIWNFKDAGVDVFIEGKASVRAPIEFNAIKSQFEGTTADEYRTPKPGQPVARRTAVAAVLDALMKLGSRA